MKYQYKVTINKWEDHNAKHKKGMGYFKFYNAFFSDAKIAELTPTQTVLFIYLLCVCSESSSNQCRISVKSLPNQLRINYQLLANSLDLFEQLQLVTVEKTPLIKLKKVIKIRHDTLNSESEKKDRQTSFSVAENSAPSPTKKSSNLTIRLESVQHLESLIPDKVWDVWCASFAEEFIDREISKAFTWSINNPAKGRKTPLGWSKFMTGWLQRGWDQYVQKLPKQPDNKIPEFRP